MRRWSPEEEAGLVAIRSRCAESLQQAAPFAEVVGDRKLVRFLRGHNFDVEKACEMVEKFLRWRRENNIDEIRRNIAEGMNHPRKFPKAEKILELVPQIVINTSIRDKRGAPICLEQYNFSPSNVLNHISLEEYVTFTIYCLEFKTMILEVC
jgi:hypothetical protein